jgi:hypothetical protein
VDPQLMIGLFSLGGVLLGGLLTPLTQFVLERVRERRAAKRSKLLVAGELLQAQLVLRSVFEGRQYLPHFEDLDALLPTVAWRENRSSIAGMVSEDLWFEMIRVYALFETTREIFAAANKGLPAAVVPEPIAKTLKEMFTDLGHVRRQLGLGGRWLDEIEDKSKRV